MNTVARRPSQFIVIDTMIASAILVGTRRRSASEVLKQFEQHIRGKSLVVAFTTVAELRYGALKGQWQSQRVQSMESWFRSVAVVMPDDDLVQTCAELATGPRPLLLCAGRNGRHQAARSAVRRP